ncbi:hypothetical protein OAJ57_03875 [Alphaproteobacteria bacterium]|nr:hypothetical protein [Alphaproteobacteria bacterium]
MKVPRHALVEVNGAAADDRSIAHDALLEEVDGRVDLEPDDVVATGPVQFRLPPVRPMTRNLFQKRVADRILILLNLDSSAVSTTGQMVETNIIRVVRHAHKNSYRTVVGQGRA